MDSNSNHDDDTGDAPENPAARAEKKRYSDRVAQQRHRQRRKDYINDLEAQLRLFKDGGESQMAQIVSENTRLRKELEQTNSMLTGIRDLLGTKAEPTVAPLSSIPQAPSSRAGSARPGVASGGGAGAHSVSASALAGVPEGSSSAGEDAPMLLGSNVAPAKHSAGSVGVGGMGPFSDLLPAAPDAQSYGSAILPSSTSAPLQPGSVLASQQFSTADPDLEQNNNWWLDPSLEAQKPPYSGYDGHGQRHETSSSPWPMTAGTLPSQRQAMELDRRQTSRGTPPFGSSHALSSTHSNKVAPRAPVNSTGTLGNLVQLFGQSDPRQWDAMFTSLSSVHFTRHHYAIPPRIPLPPPGHDVEMHGMLHIARTHMNELGSPTLKDFVSKDTTNPLSREIKVFADPMLKANMNSEYFAAYWILYLLFRWQAVLDDATYHEMPSWLRPTKLQLEVEHHFLFDQIPWPDLRDELIKLSLTNMAEAYSAVEDIGRFLSVNMYTTYEWTEANLPLLKRDLSNLGRWKLAPQFFRNHPQFSWTSAR